MRSPDDSPYESGKIQVNDEMIVRLSLSLKVPADELLGLNRYARQRTIPPCLVPGACGNCRNSLDELIRANS